MNRFERNKSDSSIAAVEARLRAIAREGTRGDRTVAAGAAAGARRGGSAQDARSLHDAGARARRLRIHWSACHAGCGQHAVADIGLVGRRVQERGETMDAVDIYMGGSASSLAHKVRELVPCHELVNVLIPLIRERLLPEPPA